MSKKAVISLSGGMDSSSLLINLLREGYQVKALSFNYGQKHSVELERAISLVKFLQDQGISNMLSHQVIDLDFGDMLYSSLVKGGAEVPEGHYEEDNMKATVVPNRNKIFSSIIQSVALSWSMETDNSPVSIAMGLHAGDHQVYPDTRPEFRDADYKAFVLGNWDADKVTYYIPYMETDKTGILKDGLVSCKQLGLDFDEVYKRTLTSYKPDAMGRSDYKSASSVERVESFLAIGRKDPVEYTADWETVVSHVEKTLKEYSNI